jgi:type I restriction enzyme S subunit
MINMGELFAFDRIKNPPMELVPMSGSEIERFGIKPGDLLFARQSLVAEGAGKCSIVLTVPEVTTFESHLIRVRLSPETADSLYYFYYFSSPEGKGNVQSLVMQVAAAGIRGSELAKLLVPLPSLADQHRISGVLSAYDELIENNSRRIDILEDVIRRLYDEWFVRLRFPGHQKTSTIESESGLVPLGWSLKSVGDVCSYINRGIAPRYEDSAAGLVLNQRCIRGQRLNLAASRRQGKAVPPDKVVRIGDVLINSTGVGTLGRVAQVLEQIPNCTVDSHVSIVRAKPDINADFFGVALLSMQSHFESQGVGATGQTELGRSRIAESPILVPSQSVQEQFGKLVRPMREMAISLQKRNENLRSTRDLLLPELISGESTVPAMLASGAVAA